jgi:alpha-L-fucosidase
LPWGRATQKPGTLYLMVFDWPADGRLLVPMKGEVRQASLLGSSQDLTWRRSAGEGGRLDIRLPKAPVDPACSVIRLDLAGEVLPMPFATYPDAGGVVTLLPHDATLQGPSLRVEQVGAVGDVTYNLGYWLDTAASAAFTVGIGAAQGGDYAVEIELACKDESAGATMTLATPSGELKFTVPATGGWQTSRNVPVGKTTLTPGVHSLVLRAMTKPGEAAVNVRSITLRPNR